MANTEFKKISLRLLPKQLEQLQELAKAKTCTYNYLIRVAIAKFLEEQMKNANKR